MKDESIIRIRLPPTAMSPWPALKTAPCRVQLLPLPIDIPRKAEVNRKDAGSIYPSSFRLHPCKHLSGDHTWLATPVPIPNTAVKQPGPMVVRKARE